MSARLILHPQSAEFAPASTDAVKNILVEVGLIGERYRHVSEENPQRYLIGPHFLQLVTFMGCAPAIELEPNEGDVSDDFCNVSLSPIPAQPMFDVDAKLASPRCPHCRKPIANWSEHIAMFQNDGNYRFACEHCHTALSPVELNWRKAGGFARMFVTIYGIYPKEAIPTEHLLSVLEKNTGQAWAYFYAR